MDTHPLYPPLENFKELVIKKLGEFPDLDFPAVWNSMKKDVLEQENRRAAGVLLLLSGSHNDDEQIYVHLIKRSRRVTQGGDVSCPGGMLNPRLDSWLTLLIRLYFWPVLVGSPRTLAKHRGPETFQLINLFLANALRETWEEIGLRPWNIRFLGPLPTYSLYTFQRTIFPLVGWIRHPWKARVSREVDRIFQIPLSAFFDINNYTHFFVTSDHDASYHLNLPAFVIPGESSRKEILWGATFNIIMRFLFIVFGFNLPSIPEDATSHRILTPEYMKGNRDL